MYATQSKVTMDTERLKRTLITVTKVTKGKKSQNFKMKTIEM